MSYIISFNNDDSIHGILIQLPLPFHVRFGFLIQYLSPLKDVDGLHYLNTGLLFHGNYFPVIPCTPKGCLTLIKSVQNDLTGLNVAIVGRSNLMGKPMLEILLKENCTVTIVHSKTLNPKRLVSVADIIISAVGVPNLIDSSWVNNNSIVIDVGISTIISCGKKLIVGDVNFNNVVSKVKAITPVPGGVGPMTISCLLENTIQIFEKFLSVYKI